MPSSTLREVSRTADTFSSSLLLSHDAYYVWNSRPQVGMGDDHSILNYLHALHAARVGLRSGCASKAQRSLNAFSSHSNTSNSSSDKGMGLHSSEGEIKNKLDGEEEVEPMWTPFGSHLACCQVCELDFTWASTSSSAAQRLMDMHHCRRYGCMHMLSSMFFRRFCVLRQKLMSISLLLHSSYNLSQLRRRGLRRLL